MFGDESERRTIAAGEQDTALSSHEETDFQHLQSKIGV